jgi:asparagine synthase (glutamine-hydrolysing)
MCGVVGFLCRGDLTADAIAERAVAMTTTLAHRGPDGPGYWTDAAAGIALGHRRLSIIDVSSAGDQPMVSSDQRWVISYNGELYNTAELRHEVENARPVQWRGHSDTEVIIEAVSLWGVRATIEKCNGMFAIAFWDRRERRLWLVRDRMGIKPLLWSRLGDGTFVFASEMRAVLAYPGFARRIEPGAVAAFMRHACIPAPLSIFQGVYKLPPAHILCVAPNGEPSLSRYWDLRGVAADGQRHIDGRPRSELADELEQLLRDAVLRQMVSDVPLGAFLSGGIDSSTVVALMQAQSSRRVHTFSIGSRDERYNEASYARQVARHLGTEHTELMVEPAAARAVVERLSDIYDEPFADSSQIPTFLVSQLARKSVTVALSGDGGDECFAGYTRHLWLDRIARGGQALSPALANCVGLALQAISAEGWDQLLKAIPRRLRPNQAGDRIHKAAALLSCESVDQAYRSAVSQWPDIGKVIPDVAEPAEPWDDADTRRALPDSLSRLRFYDMQQYLPDDILTKVDRASMAVSLEARVPLLDHRVVEFCWRLPRSALVKGTRGKIILRDVLHRYVPRQLVERPKAGFAVPIGDWIRGPLADWAAGLLSPHALSQSGLLNAEFIEQRFHEHCAGRRNWSHGLWTVLAFQAWHRRWMH